MQILPIGTDRWTISLSPDYHLLGPFPITAREQQYLSPCYPIQIQTPYVHHDRSSFPSALVDGGNVKWSSKRVRVPGRFDISYPTVRWAALRSILGWSALQHHSVLHTTMTIFPPRSSHGSELPALSVTLKQGSFVAFVPRVDSGKDGEIQWFEGDIYAQSSSPRILPIHSATSAFDPTVFDVFISLDYEIRLFGDPMYSEYRPEPISRARISIDLISPQLVVGGSLQLIPDFMDGWVLGDVFGVEVQNSSSWQTVQHVECDQNNFLSVSIETESSKFAPFQRRLLPLVIKQLSRLPGSVSGIQLIFIFSSGERRRITVPITHFPHWTMLPSSHVTLTQTQRWPVLSKSILLPPIQSALGTHYPPLVALHGAGVDVDSPFWTNAIPRQQYNWVIYPSGLSYWGYDWRGPSVLDVFGSVNALRTREPGIAEHIIVIGHSNGGQGAFFIASRYPDIVPAAIPVAAYLSASAYVPVSFSHGSHYVDPALEGILRASTAGGDNDLFLGNLTRSRLRVFHGGEDENVPVWQSRKALEIVKSFDNTSDATFEEIPGKPHWWDDTLRTPSIQHAIHDLLHDSRASRADDSPFTLTVMWPHESGSLHGWRIRQVDVPGRLSKLTVAGSLVRTTNVRCFSVIRQPLNAAGESFDIDGHPTKIIPNNGGETWISKSRAGVWGIIEPRIFRETGPISRILSYGSPITLVVPCRASSTHDRDLALARRLAHNLLTYLGIDCEILSDTEATQHLNRTSSPGSHAVIVFGGPFENKYAEAQLEIETPIEFDSQHPGCFKIRHRKFTEAGTGKSEVLRY